MDARHDRADHSAGKTDPQVAPIVVAIGRFGSGETFHLLIDAFAEVRNQHPSAHLVFADDGEAAYRAELEKRAGAQVHFLGWRRDLETLYADADLFALTSDNEGTPVAAIGSDRLYPTSPSRFPPE
ncbi:MAG: glycosyltransferase family 4 protein [Hyphomonadaceae bacterium]|nr:glycosyltransferase family 4 protein [Hyphomonadaceae bacterium]